MNISQTFIRSFSQSRVLYVKPKKKPIFTPDLLKTMGYKPPPNANPVLVKPEVELKAIILKEPHMPILLSRLDEIRDSPTGWVNRMVPPPELSFNVKRNDRNRFDIKTKQIGRGGSRFSTEIGRIEGDFDELKKVLEWRIGKNKYIIHKKMGTIFMYGWHVKKLQVMLQGMGF